MIGFFTKRTKIFFFAAAALAVAVLPVVFLLNRLSFSDSRVCWTWGPDQDSTFPKDKLIQIFYPERDGLRAIVVKPLLWNDKFDPAEAQFVFRDSNGNAVFSKKIRHFWMENSKMFELLVPSEKFQKEEKYSLEITPLIEKKPGHILGFWVTSGGCYKGKLAVNGKEMKTDLAATFRYSNGGFPENLRVLFERMAQFKPIWLKNTLVFPALILLFVLITSLFIILLAKKIGSD
jgi:hypothetical protein